jgi:hypothetical protein
MNGDLSMKKKLVRKTGVRLAVLRRAIAAQLKIPVPTGGRLIMVLWVSPEALSEESQERLHAYLTKEYHASGVRLDIL